AGHPVACASALATLDVIEREGLAERARELGAAWLEDLSRLRRHPAVRDVRGRGLMIGIELDDGSRTLSLVRALLERGWITLPAGRSAEVLQLTPPLTIERPLLERFTRELDTLLEAA